MFKLACNARRAFFAAPTILIVPFIAFLLDGCAMMASSTTSHLAGDLAGAIANQDDPQTVRDGAPAYLLLVDGLIQGNPTNQQLLIAGARLYSTYAAVFVKDPARAAHMAERARNYGLRALCQRYRPFCSPDARSYQTFVTDLSALHRSDVPALYAYASAWAEWIQTHSDDWNATAELPQLTAAMQRVVALDDGYNYGNAHVYLGVLDTLRPAALGGKPEEGRSNFKQAIALSGGHNLMAKVLYAKDYARLVYNRALHDRLLKEVIAADPHSPGLTLSNVLAQRLARKLLASADTYF